MAISVGSCAYSPEKLTPHFIDTKRMTCRKYKVIKVKPTVEFQFVEELPIDHCDGFLALPLDQALEIKREYEESLRQKKNGEK